jgi:hypothetical protein
MNLVPELLENFIFMVIFPEDSIELRLERAVGSSFASVFVRAVIARSLSSAAEPSSS